MPTQIELFPSVAKTVSQARTMYVPLNDIRSAIKNAWGKFGVSANKSTIGNAIAGTCVHERKQLCFSGNYYYFADKPNCGACPIYNSKTNSCSADPYTAKPFASWKQPQR